MKIAFLDTKTMGDIPNLKNLEKFGEVNYYATTTPSQTLSRCLGQNIVVVNKVQVDRLIMEQCPDLKLICVAATGTNNIDLTAAQEKGIVVKNVVDYSTNSVAQLTFALLLQLTNNIPYFDNYVKLGDYARNDIFTHLGPSYSEIYGKRFGIIGLGNIGRQVAKIASAFGAEVVYYSTSGKNNNPEYQRLDLPEFLATCDIISIHAPLNEHTRNLITYPQLQQMKLSALLINVGRGGIVRERDLTQALNENLIAGAALDVFETEPMDENNPLLKVNNPHKLVLTPHIAWASREARTLLMDKVIQNIEQFLEEKTEN
ncbi:D-2-hydroxyacid dehydrogenase [Adhaeribacter radiodurans]|uniref:D-2-hydroxyacid dehydrogenase n=1 Tax=Adhaeribacter radiodurans TaxID=2745197 RepID=A0A7L7L951_9BACT|nr:D-2-hydroxyacid dehydrogenase [Adhaeribacter radiodurans]QMU29351.1 D-2-hydroxyacid dehydrogenase [Adhaeribacter radiodurans]